MFDTLVIDEAGQLSLSDALAVSRAARNLVLVGDPRQLAQPLQGSHPPGVGVSALDHLLGRRRHRRARSWRAPRPHVAHASRRERFHLALLLREPARFRAAVRAPGGARGRSARRPGFATRSSSMPGDRVRSDDEAQRVREIIDQLTRGTWRSDERRGASPDPRRHRRRGAVQRTCRVPRRGAAARRSGRHRRSLSGAGGGGQHLLDGDVERRGSPAQPGVSLQPQPAQRCGLPSACRVHCSCARRSCCARAVTRPSRCGS